MFLDFLYHLAFEINQIFLNWAVYALKYLAYSPNMESEKLLKLLGEHVRNLRKARKLSQERLAELADLHTTYVSDIERGKANLSFCVVDALARALGLSLTEFLDLPQKGKATDGELLAIYSEAKQFDNKRRKAFTNVARALIKEIRELQ